MNIDSTTNITKINDSENPATTSSPKDEETQVEIIGNFHGGQTWMLDGHIDDFSVTTRFSNPPVKAIRAAVESMAEIAHYPDQSCRDALLALSNFMGPLVSANQLLLGNGASEIIDLVIRLIPNITSFRRGPHSAQYTEYERCCFLRGLEERSCEETADLSCVVNPNSPTGGFLQIDELRQYIKSTEGYVVVDESFLPFKGQNWRESSALNLMTEFPNRLIVIHSWTKIFSCPGIRVGSVLASAELINVLKKFQVPWSLNMMAQAFIVEAFKDEEYLQETWSTVPVWKRSIVNKLHEFGWLCNPNSPDWVPWVFCDVGSEKTAEQIFNICMDAGVPVRWCNTHKLPTCIRLGIRKPSSQDVLFGVLQREFGNENIERIVSTKMNVSNFFAPQKPVIA
ncbi:hypothetical protein PCE1_004485 [Barthelona sp. PCE]